jgi:hypothetical protein
MTTVDWPAFAHYLGSEPRDLRCAAEVEMKEQAIRPTSTRII